MGAESAITTDEANYLQRLLSDGAKTQVDVAVDAYELKLPPWYDDEKFKRAQRYFKQNFFAMFVAKLCGLLVILAVASILDVLVYTNQSSTAMTAYRRYLATIMHTLNWYYKELVPGSASWKSITYVRRGHIAVSKRSNAQRPGRMVSQKDMAVTQFGFIGYAVLGRKKIGIVNNPQDMEALVHFWRVIGYMLGIQDRYNLCADNLAATEQRMQQVQNEILRPALMARKESFEKMGRALIEGLWCFNPFLDYDAFVFFVSRLTGVPGYHYWPEEHPHPGCETKYDHFSRYSRFILYFLILVHESWLHSTLFRWYLNSQMIISRFLITYFPFLAFYKFGIKNSYVRILK